MTHHDGNPEEHSSGESDNLEEEAADFVYPVDHGEGTKEAPLITEDKGDYVTPVDHGDDK